MYEAFRVFFKLLSFNLILHTCQIPGKDPETPVPELLHIPL